MVPSGKGVVDEEDMEASDEMVRNQDSVSYQDYHMLYMLLDFETGPFLVPGPVVSKSSFEDNFDNRPLRTTIVQD